MFESLYFNLFYIISAVPQFILILYIIILKPGRHLSDFDIGRFRLTDLPKAVVTLLGIYICIIPVGLISTLIEPELNNQLVYGSGWQFTKFQLIPLVLLSCMVTGYTEEIFFRSYLYKSFQKAGAGIIPAALAVNLLFGVGHIYEGYYAFAATTVIGFFLTYIFIKTKSIHAVAIGHGLYNFSVLIISMTGAL